MHEDRTTPSTRTAPEVTTYLEELVARYTRQGQVLRAAHGPEALVLQHGRAFRGTPWETWRGRGWRRRNPKRCFNNAMNYSHFDGLAYAEGFASTEFGPAHHAWCVTEDDQVVDPTWHDATNKTEYLGIVFPPVLSAKLFLAEKGCHLNALMLANHSLRAEWLAELASAEASSIG